jgi:hypothetical protein
MTSFSTDIKTVRRFGLIAIVFFGAIAGAGLWRGHFYAPVIFGILSVSGIFFAVMPIKMRGGYIAWMKVAQVISSVVNAVILTLFYFLVMTPFGVVMRIMGKELIPAGPDEKAETYWVDRKLPYQKKENFLKRY